MRVHPVVVALAWVSYLAACAGCVTPIESPPSDGGVEVAPSSDAMTTDGCDPPQLTYANFGMAFLGTYCNRCHGFTQQIVQGEASLISGAAATGTFMPPGSPQPTAQQRANLGAWLACGAP